MRRTGDRKRLSDLSETAAVPDTVDSLRLYLEKGATGRLSVLDSEGTGHSVYVMQGEVLAAESADDAKQILLRLLNSGALTQNMYDRLQERLDAAKGLGDLLFGQREQEAVMRPFGAGRIFGELAVVAQEVKSLAEQSKQATAQVRTILMDVQKATSAAVMATEQGSKAVEAGVRQSAEAGDAIKVLAESMVEAAQSATQIAASSQQQLVGMDQVALAMENIKQASSQNAASTKQAEASAQNLHELGQKLKRLVDGGKS